MDLENLKELWQQQEAEKAPENLEALLGKKSKSPIARMKRNLFWELGIVVVSYGLSIIFFFTAWKGRFSSVSWLYLFIGIFFIVYYIRKYQLLKNMECMACQVRSNLDKQVRLLEKYIHFYLVTGTAIMPVLMIFSYWFLQTQLPNVDREVFKLASENIPVFKSLMYWVSITLILTVLFYYVNKYYVKKLYGKHIDTLKDMLEQMEDDKAVNNTL